MDNRIYKLFSGVIILLLISKGLGFVRESMVAARYGAGFVSDVYVFEDGLINAIYTVCAGVIGTTFIPKALSLEKDRRNYFTVNYMNILFVIIATISLTMAIFAPIVLKLMVPGFYRKYTVETMSQLVFLTRVNMISLILVFLENYLIVVLQASNYFIFSSLQGIILNSSLILYLFFLYDYEIIGIIFIKLLAHMVNILILIIFINKKKLVEFIPCFNPGSKDIKEVIRLAAPVVSVNMVSQFNYIIDRSMASSLNSGSMAILSYANTIAALLYSIVGVSLSSIAYTELSEKQENTDSVKEIFNKYLFVLLGMLIPCCIVMCIDSREISSIIYERGKVSRDNIAVLSKILILYVPSYLALCTRDLYNRLLYIHKKNSISAIINFYGLVLNIILNVVFTKLIGVYGLALATSVTSGITVIITIHYCRSYIEYNRKKIIMLLIKTLISGVFCLGIYFILPLEHFALKILLIIVSGITALIIFNYGVINVVINSKKHQRI